MESDTTRFMFLHNLKEFLVSDLAKLTLEYLNFFPYWALIKWIKPLHEEGDVTYEDVPFFFRVISFDGETIVGYQMIQHWDQSPTEPIYDGERTDPFPDAFVWHGGLHHPIFPLQFREDEVELIPFEKENAQIAFVWPVVLAEYHSCHWCGCETAYHGTDNQCRCVQIPVGELTDSEFKRLYVFFFFHLFSQVIRESKKKIRNMPENQFMHTTKMEVPGFIDSWIRHSLLIVGDAIQFQIPTNYELLRRICTCTEKSVDGSLTHFVTETTEWAHFCSHTCVDLWREYLDKCHKMHRAHVEENDRQTDILLNLGCYGKIKPTNKRTTPTRKRKQED